MNNDDSVKSSSTADYWPREKGMSEATWRRLVELSRKKSLVQSIRQLMNPLSSKDEHAMIKIPAKVAESYRARSKLPMTGFAKHEDSAALPIMGEADWAATIDASQRHLVRDIHELISALTELAKTEMGQVKMLGADPSEFGTPLRPS